MKTESLLENFQSFLNESQVNPENKGLFISGGQHSGDAVFLIYDIETYEEILNDFELKKMNVHINGRELVDFDVPIGMIGVMDRSEDHGPCYGAWEVHRSAVHSHWRKRGFGKLLYEIAMVHLGVPLMSDRSSVSDYAARVWNSLSDVHYKTDDFDNIQKPQTPPPEDDCIVKSHEDNIPDWALKLNTGRANRIKTVANEMIDNHEFFMEELQHGTKLNKEGIKSLFLQMAVRLFNTEYGG